MARRLHVLALAVFAALFLAEAETGRAHLAGAPAADALVVASDGTSKLSISVAADAGPWELRAAKDLQKYIRLMTGTELSLVVGGVAPPDNAIIVGNAALAAEPSLRLALAAVAKKDPLVQADAIALRREGSRVFLAGSNDESIYFAASWLLQQWGCRWYMPTAFGEVVPHHRTLAVGALDYAYAPPFEIRNYWLSWNADTTGADEFRHRNFMSSATMIGNGQALDRYTADIAPKGGTAFDVPFSDPRTAEHVAEKIGAAYAAGKDTSLAIADGNYFSPTDAPLISEFDRHMLEPSLTDAMLTFYNNLASILRRQYPSSKAKIGAMAYANVTLPPRKVTEVAPNVVMWLAPIDFDPNHAIDDPRSISSQEYGVVLNAWARLMPGRLAIYDYDQGMLVWRDLPDPSQYVFARNVKAYRRAGILGISTESRGATATTFLNLFFRGQLMWNPDADVDRLLAEFYPGFYGPAAGPMSRYWGRIFAAWQATDVTEHEYMAAPAIYTPELVRALGTDLRAAETALASSDDKSGDVGLYRQRLAFTRLSFEIIRNYVAMTELAARDVDYADAAGAGDRALAARLELARTNPTFTVHVLGPEAEKPDGGPVWMAGEVQWLKQLQALTDGRKGVFLEKLPLDWSFRIAQPLPANWSAPDLLHPAPPAVQLHEDPASSPQGGWKSVRSDLYLQAQGIRAPGNTYELGYYAYQVEVPLRPSVVAGPVHLSFPGLFNEAWLYVNGTLVAHRDYEEPWWNTGYHFEWDVDLSGKLSAGRNVIQLIGFNPHHFAGMFYRPFLYRLR